MLFRREISHSEAHEIQGLERDLARKIKECAELEAELYLYRKGHQGACYACEPVGELNVRLEAELERTINAIHQYMMTTQQQASKERLVESFVEMYTYKERSVG